MEFLIKSFCTGSGGVIGGYTGATVMTGLGFAVAGPIGGAICFGIGSVGGTCGGMAIGANIGNKVVESMPRDNKQKEEKIYELQR